MKNLLLQDQDGKVIVLHTAEKDTDGIPETLISFRNNLLGLDPNPLTFRLSYEDGKALIAGIQRLNDTSH